MLGIIPGTRGEVINKNQFLSSRCLSKEADNKVFSCYFPYNFFMMLIWDAGLHY